MSEGPMRLATLSVLGGPLHGRKIDVAPVGAVLIGSDSECQLHLDQPGISPVHARLRMDSAGTTVHDERSPSGVFINFDRVEREAPLQEGDMIWLGPPQAPGSILIQCLFEPRKDEAPAPAVAVLEAPAAATPQVVVPEAPEVAVPDVVLLDVSTGPAAPPPAAPPASAPFVIEESAEMDAAPLGTESAGPSLAAPGFDDFVAAQEPTPLSAPVAAAGPGSASGDADFLVAGFEAEWPEVESTAAPAEPTAAASASDDQAFFIGDEAPPPPPPPSTGEDVFFTDDEPVALAPPAFAPPPTAMKPPPAHPEAEPAHPEAGPVTFSADEFFMSDEPPAQAAAPVTPPIPRPAPQAPSPLAPKTPPKAPAPKAEGKAPEPVAQGPVATKGPAPPPKAPKAEGSPRRPDVSPARTPTPRREEEGAARPAPRAARPAAPAKRSGSQPLPRLLLLGGGGLAMAAALGFAALRFLGGAQILSIEPAHARVGEIIVLVVKGLAADPQGTVVLFGDKPGNVVKSEPGRLEVMVPQVVTAPGQDVRVPVRISVGGRTSRPMELAVFGGPTLHGISPDVAMPGDEVVLAGLGWKLGATVRFGTAPADVLDVRDTTIRVRVPVVLGGPGTSASVVVSEGASESNPAPFYIGRIPLVLKVEPARAVPGEVVAIGGRGFQRDPARNAVMVAGVRALIVSALDDELKVVVPQVGPGDEARPIEVRTAGSENVGQATVAVPSPGEADFHFLAEPFDAAYGKNHAVVGSDLGPAFVLAASGGKTAADRAVEVARRLNEAAGPLKATRGLNIEGRDLDTNPALALAGHPELLLEVTAEDAAAYNEDWTGLKGRGGPVTRSRLARWWEAVARDLVLLLVRSEKPQFAPALAPEGRALGDLFLAVGKPGGLHAAVARPATRDALRLVAFRVPAAVPGPPAATASAATAPAAAVAAAPLRLEGSWIGTEIEGDERRDLTATFKNGAGSIAYEGRVTLTVPFQSLEQPQKNAVRFSLQVRGGIRYYNGRWDGQTLTGKVSRDPAGGDSVATFDLRPR